MTRRIAGAAAFVAVLSVAAYLDALYVLWRWGT